MLKIFQFSVRSTAVVCLLLFTALLGAQEDSETADTPPFASGERLVYDIGWGFFAVGQAELLVEPGEWEGQPALKLMLTARTNSFADTFYKVRNTTVAWVDLEVTRALHYHNIQREGDRHRELKIYFDWEAGTAQYHNVLSGELREPVDILEGTFDPMSITFFVRTLALQTGSVLEIPTTNGKELFMTVVDVAELERRRFRLGRQQAFVLKPDTKDLGGVFKKDKNSELRFWYGTGEGSHILRMESSVAVGSFWTELTEVWREGKQIAPKKSSKSDSRRPGRRR